MTCPQCGNENPPKLKFCVKCGTNLDNPQEINYEQVDMGNYHSEEDQSSGGFSLGSGTFTIRDTAPAADSSSDFYTADELNNDEEEFDFSSFDEPFIPKLDADRLSMPPMNNPTPHRGTPQQPFQTQQQNHAMGGIPPTPQMGGMPAMAAMPQPVGMNGIPQQTAPVPPQPQIIGYDQNGMPVYGQVQPMMFPQPQIIGYDQNGMPVYGQVQPMMFPQPQIIGYDQNGMPIYGQAQPMMFQQPPVQPVQNDMPGMPGMPNIPSAGAMPGVSAMGAMPQMQPFPRQNAVNQPVKERDAGKKRVEVSDDFWKFFDGGKSADHSDNDDFFGKKDIDAADPGGMDSGRLKRFEHRKNDYMSDTPLVDGSKLAANTEAKYNKLYMRRTDIVDAGGLEAKNNAPTQDIMSVTKEVDADTINVYKHYKTRISMEHTEDADAGQLEAYNPEHRESIMAQADHAVEALPKKKTTYVDEIDAIELPEYMQARKTVRIDEPQIPDLPEV